jgi:hypothetical protein
MYNTTKSALGILPVGRIPSAERIGLLKAVGFAHSY